MNLKSILALVLAGSFVVPTAAAEEYTTTYQYIGVGGDAVIEDCNAALTGVVIGGGCFDVAGDETSVSLSVSDVTGLRVGMYIAFRDATDTDIGTPVVSCDPITLSIPADTARVLVFLDQALFVLDCGATDGGPATTGTLSATFTV